MKANIIIDVMGGDNPAAELVRGAATGARECGASLTFVGDGTEIRCALDGLEANIVDAPEAVFMTDDAMSVIRAKSGSSMATGCRMLAAGEGDIFISCGNTGALYTAASHYVRCYRGLRRAALSAIVPMSQPFVMADAGANPEADALSLLRFAKLGEIYCQAVLGVGKPRVALISNGTEPQKGTKIYREAYGLLAASDMNFVGNCEGRDLPFGACDVAVCDGFTGNVVIKLIEGMGRFMTDGLKTVMDTNAKTKLGGLLVRGELKKFMKGLDDTAYGGAPLLGISKPVVKVHGNASEKTMRSAVIQANGFAERKINEKMAEGIASLTVTGA